MADKPISREEYFKQLGENPIHPPIIKEGKYADGDQGTEEERQELVKFYKLPDDATWNDIWEAVWEADRKEMSRRYGLEENASWDDLHSIMADKLILSGKIDDLLGIPPDITPEERLEKGKFLKPNYQESLGDEK